MPPKPNRYRGRLKVLPKGGATVFESRKGRKGRKQKAAHHWSEHSKAGLLRTLKQAQKP
jgi:hypothetical protein